MRGGAIPLLVWALLLSLLYAINVVWSHTGLDAAMGGFAVLVIFGTAAAFVLLAPREALRRGPPSPSREPEAVPLASYGAVLLAVGVAAMVYGFAFGHFLVYFGAGIIVVGLGILAREIYAERRALREWRGRERG